MTEVQDSPNQNFIVEQMNNECLNLREQLTNVRNQKAQLAKTFQRQEGEQKVCNLKIRSLNTELQQIRKQNKKLLQAFERQKNERVELMTNQQSVLNNLSMEEVELTKFTNENDRLKKQIEAVEKELEEEKISRVSAIRQKQNVSNQIKLLETKLEAASGEAKYSKVSQKKLQYENKRLQEEISRLSEKSLQRQGPLEVQTINKDNQQTTTKLLKEFQMKMRVKDDYIRRQIEQYETKNMKLAARVIQLENSEK